MVPFSAPCRAGDNFFGQTEAEWLERARIHAIGNCVSFFDEDFGVYRLASRPDFVVYSGMRSEGDFGRELVISMSSNGKLMLISVGNASIYPPDTLTSYRDERYCRSYKDFHNSEGHPVRDGWGGHVSFPIK